MSETHTLKEFRGKLRVEELLVFDSGSWSWSVRPTQPTLGSGIISLNRYALRLSDVSVNEMAELASLIQKLEKAIKVSFNPNIMNYLMLMMVDHHVHYHVIPRYDGMQTFNNLEWVDNGWAGLPVMSDKQHQDSPDTLQAIKNALKSSID